MKGGTVYGPVIPRVAIRGDAAALTLGCELARRWRASL